MPQSGFREVNPAKDDRKEVWDTYSKNTQNIPKCPITNKPCEDYREDCQTNNYCWLKN